MLSSALGIPSCPRCGRRSYKAHEKWCLVLTAASPFPSQQPYPQPHPFPQQPRPCPPLPYTSQQQQEVRGGALGDASAAVAAATPRCGSCHRKSFKGHHLWCPTLYQQDNSFSDSAVMQSSASNDMSVRPGSYQNAVKQPNEQNMRQQRRQSTSRPLSETTRHQPGTSLCSRAWST